MKLFIQHNIITTDHRVIISFQNTVSLILLMTVVAFSEHIHIELTTRYKLQIQILHLYGILVNGR
jgi:hypothetical protein